jgi:hypothetical protein
VIGRDGAMLDAHLIGKGPIDVPTTYAGRAAAGAAWSELMAAAGFPAADPIGSNGKLAKGVGTTVGTTLSPATLSGRWDVCQHRTAACTAACVLDSGQSRFANVRAARAARTALLADHPDVHYGATLHALLDRHGRPRAPRRRADRRLPPQRRQ